MIGSGESVVGILTGHVLKDPEAVIGYHADTLPNITGNYANHLYEAGPSVEELARILQRNREPLLA